MNNNNNMNNMNNTKIMDLKKGVGIDYCYKSKETGEKDTLGSIAVKSKETRRKVSTCQHGPIYLANA